MRTRFRKSPAVRPVVERRYGLDEIVEAFRNLGTGNVPGKLVVSV